MTRLTARPKLILPSSGATKKRIVTYSMRPWLEEGETISVVSVTTAEAGVTLSACTINTVTHTVDGVDYVLCDDHLDPVGTVFSFFISGQVVNTNPLVLADVTTSGGQDIEDVPIQLECRSG